MDLGFNRVSCLLSDYTKVIGFGNYRQSAPGAMKLTDGIYILNHALLAIVAVVLAFEVDDSDALSYLVGTLFLLFCLVHIVVFLSVKPIFKSLEEEHLGAWTHHIVVAHNCLSRPGVPLGWSLDSGKINRLDFDVIVLIEHLA